jgi:hypothetical protein
MPSRMSRALWPRSPSPTASRRRERSPTADGTSTLGASVERRLPPATSIACLRPGPGSRPC